MRLVLNASPIICLAKAGLLGKVFSPGDQLAVPRPVYDEILAFDNASDPAVRWLQGSEGSGLVFDVGAIPPFIAAWDLGAGESSVLASVLASPPSIAVLDDLAARRCALALRLNVTGTLGLLLEAKKCGRITSLKEALAAIRDAGLFISPKHVSDLCKLAGE